MKTLAGAEIGQHIAQNASAMQCQSYLSRHIVETQHSTSKKSSTIRRLHGKYVDLLKGDRDVDEAFHEYKLH